MSDERGPAELLSERPEMESALESVLDADDERGGWTFDDVDVDSGTFGELVSRGVVEKDGGEYYVADPAAVRAALDGEQVDTDDGSGFDPRVALPDVEPRAVGLLTAAIAVVVLARAYVVGAVYRGGDIVLSGNDPYYYRYWVERVAADAGGVVDFASLTVLPTTVTRGEPLMVATLWWVAELLGGTTESIGHVLAWYPVVSAVVSAVLVYLLAVRVTADQRVGLASVLFLALVPGHAFRTSLGFADHHAFDYPWLGLTALALLVVVTTASDRDSLRTVAPWVGGVLLGVGIAGQVLSWEAGPLLVVPVGLVALAKTLLDVDAGRPPVVVNAPIAAGSALAAALVWLVHTSWGWHTELVATTPALLLVGIVGVVVTATATTRLGFDTRALAVVDALGIGVVAVVGRTVFTTRWNELFARTGALFRSDAIAETAGLFDPGSLGFLLLFGFALVVALPAMVWGSRRVVDGHADWLVLTVYGWYFLLLATIQIRFVGELATFTAVFAGYAFVWLASKVEVARPLGAEGASEFVSAHTPDGRTLASLGLLFLLVSSFGVVQVPVKNGQVAVEDGVYRTAVAVEDDATERGLAYPENYVLSQWGNSRVFNYFVNGNAESYLFARSNYADFLRSQDGHGWYDRLRDRVGYVVTRNRPEAGPETLQSRLHDDFGSRSGSAAGLGHYRAMYTTGDGTFRAFELVPGASIEGTTDANATVTATATVAIPNAEFDYRRETRAAANGSYRLVVANPGTYTVQHGNETTTVTVTETAVRNGTAVPAA